MGRMRMADRYYFELNNSEEKLQLILQQIGCRMSAERNKQSLTVAEAALRCGFDSSNIYRIERGENVFLKTFLRYVYALERPIELYIPFNEEQKTLKTLGSQIDSLTSELSVREKNQILNVVVSLVNAMQAITFCSK